MIAASKENLSKVWPNLQEIVEFAVEDIEYPSSDFLGRFKRMTDFVFSNGVLNLCSNKLLAFQNVRKLLKPGTSLDTLCFQM